MKVSDFKLLSTLPEENEYEILIDNHEFILVFNKKNKYFIINNDKFIDCNVRHIVSIQND